MPKPNRKRPISRVLREALSDVRNIDAQIELDERVEEIWCIVTAAREVLPYIATPTDQAAYHRRQLRSALRLAGERV